MKQAGLRRKRWFIARFTAVAFDRIEQRRFFPANVCSRSAPQLDIKTKSAAENVLPQELLRSSGFDGVIQPIGRQRILPANIDVALLRAHREPGNRHPLQNRKRIALHHDTILEGARLRFIRVANYVMRVPKMALQMHRFPFLPRGKCRTPTPQQFRIDDFLDDAFRAKLERPSQCFITATLQIILNAGRIDLSCAPQQAQLRLPRLWH